MTDPAAPAEAQPAPAANPEPETSPAPAGLDPSLLAYLQWLFSYDELHVRQKVLTLAQKYTISDGQGYPRFFVVRPPRLAINIVLGLFLTVVRLAIFIGAFYLISATGSLLIPLLLLFISNFFLGVAATLMAPYRDIDIYTDESLAWRVMAITQDNKMGLYRQYTLWDCLGGKVAVLRRDTIRSIIRREWLAEAPNGDFLFRCREDSWVRAALRRYLGTLYGLLRTNFNFEHGDGTVFGVYNRKLTLIDEYVLDLSGDPARHMDRRAALAMSILLDTAEMR
ncbi:MAG: hypothetical protein RLY93_17675 [Sumerlaeia bacterium]